MKILLVYPGTIVREVPLNLLYISSSLKKAGFDTKVFELTPYSKQKMFRDTNKYIEKEFEKLLIDYQPDIVGISLMTINYQISMRLAKIVKEKTEAKVICGGIHPTIDPEDTINEKDVEFHIYTQVSREYLEGIGLLGKNVVYYGYISNKELPRIQKNADILFLPMTFGGVGIDPDIVKTASPSKIPEYLAAGRPITCSRAKRILYSMVCKKTWIRSCC